MSVGFKQAKFDASVHLAGNAALLGVLTFGAHQVASDVQSTCNVILNLIFQLMSVRSYNINYV